MYRIGNFDIVEDKRLIVPNSGKDDIWVDFKVDNELIQIRLLFTFDESQQRSTIKILGKTDHSEISLINWSRRNKT